MNIEEAAFRLFPRLIHDPYNPMDDGNEEYRDIWIEGAIWNQEQQDILAIKFGVWLSVNCEQDKSKDGWWLYEKKWLTTDECLLKFKNGNTTNTI
jgi:hypothetical protein